MRQFIFLFLFFSVAQDLFLSAFELLQQPSHLISSVERQEADIVKLHYEVTYPKDLDIDLLATRDHLLVGFSPMPAPFLLSGEQIDQPMLLSNGMQKQTITYTLLPLSPFTLSPQVYFTQKDEKKQKVKQLLLPGDFVVIDKMGLPDLSLAIKPHQLDLSQGLLPIKLDSEIEKRFIHRDKSSEIVERLTNRQLPWWQFLLCFGAALLLILVTFVWQGINGHSFNLFKNRLKQLRRKIVERKLYKAAHRGELRQIHYHLLAKLLKDSLDRREPQLPRNATVEEIEPFAKQNEDLLEGIVYLKYCDEIRFSNFQKDRTAVKQERERFLCWLKWSCKKIK